MQVYAGRTMNKRPTPVVTIPESSIQSGDFLGIIRWVGFLGLMRPCRAWAAKACWTLHASSACPALPCPALPPPLPPTPRTHTRHTPTLVCCVCLVNWDSRPSCLATPADDVQSTVCVCVCGSFDGLDPMLAWAMGSTTGHTAITVRDPVSGQLFVHESTVKVGGRQGACFFVLKAGSAWRPVC
jgi:hypothetical protein